MPYSMTGYGRAVINHEGHEMTIEIKSLNHRYIDFNIRLPRNLSFLEDEIRKSVQERISRGRIEIYVNYQNNREDSKTVKIDFPLLSAYIDAFEQIKSQTNLEDDIQLSFITKLPDLLNVTEKEENDETLKTIARHSVSTALDALIQMRRQEGEKLAQDILSRVEYIHRMVDKIEERAPFVVEEYRDKLKMRIEELLQGNPMDETRFNTEVAFFADRSNITEEIVRLKSHMEQMRNTIYMNQSIGRKLDFIIQEMNREINTIGSKASDLTIVNFVVDVKSEIEKIREQVQNIE